MCRCRRSGCCGRRGEPLPWERATPVAHHSLFNALPFGNCPTSWGASACPFCSVLLRPRFGPPDLRRYTPLALRSAQRLERPPVLLLELLASLRADDRHG